MAKIDDVVQKLIDTADVGLGIVRDSFEGKKTAPPNTPFTLQLLDASVRALESAEKLGGRGLEK